MLALLTLALFSTSVHGDITTAIWAYSNPDPMDYTSVGSVVGSSSDRTTVEFTVADYTNTKDTTSPTPETFTLGGLTYVEYTVTATIPVIEGYSTGTVVVACSRANEQVLNATCMQSVVGTESSMSEYCGFYSRSEIQTTTYLYFDSPRSDRSAHTYTATQTNDFRGGMPTWCTNSTALSERAKQPTTFEGDAMATHALVLTAGLEKLSASATGSGLEAGSAASTTRGGTSTPTSATQSIATTGAAVSKHLLVLLVINAIVAFFR
ncbi:hypothetical protein OPT61_g4572 [Boeremia exigua]|uniref:Uncharacterized protein n=1 Tax=Boeremia exigua TaxID=749465 RepID=A0ACC2IDK7_9PLEO|nr:hypothetical protein OPT61_g4572 [Boeremia exigua]